MAHLLCELQRQNTRPKRQWSFVGRLLLSEVRIGFKHPGAEEGLKLGVPMSMVDVMSIRSLSHRREGRLTY